MTQLTPYQMELLGILQEECAEVIQIISKIRRFGIDSYNPTEDPNVTNMDLLNLEIADVQALVEMIKETDNSPVIQEVLDQRIHYKKQKVLRYLHT